MAARRSWGGCGVGRGSSHTESICIATVGNKSICILYDWLCDVNPREIITRARVVAGSWPLFLYFRSFLFPFSVSFRCLASLFFLLFASFLFCFTVGFICMSLFLLLISYTVCCLWLLNCPAAGRGVVKGRQGTQEVAEAEGEELAWGVSMVALSISGCGIWMINVFT